MIKTKFSVDDLDSLVVLWVEFKEKLDGWKSKHPNTTWDMSTYILEDSFEIIVVVNDETEDNN
jgi:hypothetical protein